MGNMAAGSANGLRRNMPGGIVPPRGLPEDNPMTSPMVPPIVSPMIRDTGNIDRSRMAPTSPIGIPAGETASPIGMEKLLPGSARPYNPVVPPTAPGDKFNLNPPPDFTGGPSLIGGMLNKTIPTPEGVTGGPGFSKGFIPPAAKNRFNRRIGKKPKAKGPGDWASNPEGLASRLRMF